MNYLIFIVNISVSLGFCSKYSFSSVGIYFWELYVLMRSVLACFSPCQFPVI